jgi:hypothetical protein
MGVRQVRRSRSPTVPSSGRDAASRSDSWRCACTVYPVTSFDLWYNACSWAVFGAITASFLCVVGERVPRGMSIGGRSHCVCGRQLRWRENLPILGYLTSRGVARCCGARIPRFYLIAELLLAAAWALAGAAWSTNPLTAVTIAAVSAGGLVLGARRALR